MAMQVQSLVANKPCYEKEFIDFEFDKHIDTILFNSANIRKIFYP